MEARISDKNLEKSANQDVARDRTTTVVVDGGGKNDWRPLNKVNSQQSDWMGSGEGNRRKRETIRTLHF